MKRSLMAFVALACAALPALAQNSLWLNNSALSRMNRADTELFLKAAREALNAPDGHVVTWSNPGTGASGTVKVIASSKEKGMACRTVETTAFAGGIQGMPTPLKACRVGDKWRLVS